MGDTRLDQMGCRKLSCVFQRVRAIGWPRLKIRRVRRSTDAVKGPFAKLDRRRARQTPIGLCLAFRPIDTSDTGATDRQWRALHHRGQLGGSEKVRLGGANRRKARVDFRELLRRCKVVTPFHHLSGGQPHQLGIYRGDSHINSASAKRDGGKGEPPTPRPCVGFLELRRRRGDFFAGWDFIKWNPVQ
jgi:hypothetical protein